MKNINYSPYDLQGHHRLRQPQGDTLPKKIYDLIRDKFPNFEEIEYCSVFKIRNVESPFILADNTFDLSEANNDLYEFGVKRTKTVQFTGGCFYIVYEKDSNDSIIIHGNMEEGYNIFLLS